MTERLDRIEALLLQCAERQLAHESRFERMDASIERIDAQFERLQQQLSAINATLDRVAQGQGRNETQIGQNAEAISELRAVVAS